MQVSNGQESLFLDQDRAGDIFGTIQGSNLWGGAGRQKTFRIFDGQKINQIKYSKIFHIFNWKAWSVQFSADVDNQNDVQHKSL